MFQHYALSSCALTCALLASGGRRLRDAGVDAESRRGEQARLPDGVGTSGVFPGGPQIPYARFPT